jgi:CHAT domain-containing protein
LEQKLQTVSHEMIANALPMRTRLIEFVRCPMFDFEAVPIRSEISWKPAHYLAFVLQSEKPESVRMIDLGEATTIDKMISDFTMSLKATGKSYEDLRDKGSVLRAAVFDPLTTALGNGKNLFLALDDELNMLPFQVLPTGQDDYLIDNYQITYLSTGRDILRFGVDAAIVPSDPLVAADPDFDLSRDNGRDSESSSVIVEIAQPPVQQTHELSSTIAHFDRVEGTRIEGELIADLLGVRPILGREVLETRIKAVRSPLILHIATQGYFLTSEPDDLNKDNDRGTSFDKSSVINRLSGDALKNPMLRSGLALAGANTWLRSEQLPEEAEDGLLTAEDVTGMDLLGTEMVVLSASETGLGEVHTGEGVFGLRRAFELAGARTIVMSLWKVPDQLTTDLMVDFYRRISYGKPRAEALREAQLAIRKKYSDPFYWGAFICQGNPGPLKSILR